MSLLLDIIGGLAAFIIPLAIWVWRIQVNGIRHIDERLDRLEKRVIRLENIHMEGGES